MPFQTQDPVTGAYKAQYNHAEDAEICRVLDLLAGAQSTWRNESWRERQGVLEPLADRLTADRDRLAALITEEMGKPIRESRAEVDKCIQTVRRALREDLSFLNTEMRPSPHGAAAVELRPLGVLYSIMPWNLPLWQAVRMVIPALLAGNTVLLKHSELTPLTAAALEELFADLYRGPLLRHLHIGHEKTEMIMASPHVGGVSLTGSVEAGRKVYRAAAGALKKAVLELGGSDPYIIREDADLDFAAALVAKGRLLNGGQTCISVKRCLVHKNSLPDFTERLKREFDKAVFGPPSAEATTLGPLAHRRFKDSLRRQLEEFVKNTGAVRIYSKPHGQAENSAYVDAEIYLLERNSDWLKNQEIFAPVLILIPYENEAQAVQIANSTDFALGAGVISRDPAAARALAAHIQAGHVAINALVSSDLSLPFGGFKSSGFGRELGREAYFEFTQTKVIAGG